MSKQLAVLGSPISHSKSPQIHDAAYRTLGKDYEYSKIEIQKNHLMQFVETLDENWIGLSVTAPLKEEALRLARNADLASKATGASNTLLRVDDGWTGFNTDVFGIQQSLVQAGINAPTEVSVIGTGATARSVIYSVATLFPGLKLKIAGRNRVALNDLLNFAKGLNIKSVSRVSTSKALAGKHLVISTLPAGALDPAVQSFSKSWIRRPNSVFFDVAYEPWPSKGAALWLKNKLPVISGIEMLLWQAIAQVRVFCEGDPSKELFNEAAVMLAMRNSIGLI